MEVNIVKAKSHVQMYQIHRNWARKVISIARLDITKHLPSIFCHKLLTIDMGQNLCLPNYECKQPGDTYYMSTLTVLLLVVVSNSTYDGQDRMNAYISRDFEGDHGQNNITSCLLMDLKIRVWLSPPNYGNLTYIADKCGVQKKLCAMRFLMWLVEAKIFPKVTLLFLVKDHTKNSADRMFNLLKITYHCQDILTYDELHSVLSEHEFVNVIKMDPSNFNYHLKWLYKHYRVP